MGKRKADAGAGGDAAPAKRSKARSGASQETAELRFRSPAEFFAENKNIAGFDNPGKSLYTTVRELVENGLDAAEAVPILPAISVKINQVSRSQYNSIVGIEGRDMVDKGLYKDVENEKERKIREKKAAKAAAKTQSSSAPVISAPMASQVSAQGRDAVNYFLVTVEDNGTGMPHEQVPDMMGRVLAGTKYSVRQARGKFGLGSKMALIWAKMSTGMPVKIRTAQSATSLVTECTLDIDISKNIPNVIRQVQVPNTGQWQGTEVEVMIEGNWTTYRARIVQYLRQMAVITPYAEFKFDFVAEKNSFSVTFARRSEVMPAPAKEVKHHPSSVNQLLIKQLISYIPPKTTFLNFLTKQFSSINREHANRLIAELDSEKFSASMPVSALDISLIRQLDILLKAARFDSPNGNCLSPAGEYNLRLGIMKELQPDLVATHAADADVFEGHPFIVETGISLGGSNCKPGVNVFRFANRIPLLFEGGNDVVTQTATKAINWSSYKISVANDKIGVFCSIVSTKIPFKGTGKEYIAEDADSIKKVVKKSIMQCCSQLRTKLVRKAALKDRAERKKNINKYAPDVANAIMTFFESLESSSDPALQQMLDQVANEQLTREVFRDKLLTHVAQTDHEHAIERAAATGEEKGAAELLLFAPRASGYTAVMGENGPVQEGVKVQLLSKFRVNDPG